MTDLYGKVFSIIGTMVHGLTEFNFSGVAPSVNNRHLGKGILTGRRKRGR